MLVGQNSSEIDKAPNKSAKNPMEPVDILSVPKKGSRLTLLIKNFWPFIVATITVFTGLIVFLVYHPAAEKFTGSELLLIPSQEDPYLGSADAPVIVITIADLFGADARYFFETIEPTLTENYINKGKAKLYIWPTSEEDENLEAFEALYCANEQNKFWVYRTDFLRNIGAFGAKRSAAVLTEAEYQEIARISGLDKDNFTSCLRSQRYSDYISRRNGERLEAGLAESNTVLVNGAVIVGATTAELSAQIDRNLH